MSADQPTLIQHLISHPKKLFLLDAAGAVFSAFMLYVVLKDFSGMPARVLNQLAAIALFCAVYSFSCYAFVKSKWKNFMRFLSVLNGCYCVLTLVLIVIHFTTIHPAGIIYFIAEIAIIAKLAITELQAVRYSSTNNDNAKKEIA